MRDDEGNDEERENGVLNRGYKGSRCSIFSEYVK